MRVFDMGKSRENQGVMMWATVDLVTVRLHLPEKGVYKICSIPQAATTFSTGSTQPLRMETLLNVRDGIPQVGV